jgi:hypothetical protein
MIVLCGLLSSPLSAKKLAVDSSINPLVVGFWIFITLLEHPNKKQIVNENRRKIVKIFFILLTPEKSVLCDFGMRGIPGTGQLRSD